MEVRVAMSEPDGKYLGVAVLGAAVLGTAVLGVAVLGTAVLQPGPRIQPSLDFRGTFPKEHHTQHAVSSPIHDGPSNAGYLGVAVRGVAVLGTAVLHRTLTHSAQPWFWRPVQLSEHPKSMAVASPCRDVRA